MSIGFANGIYICNISWFSVVFSERSVRFLQMRLQLYGPVTSAPVRLKYVIFLHVLILIEVSFFICSEYA
jgi:hypothetical protein